jgi:hypothetical protein
MSVYALLTRAPAQQAVPRPLIRSAGSFSAVGPTSLARSREQSTTTTPGRGPIRDSGGALRRTDGSGNTFGFLKRSR